MIKQIYYIFVRIFKLLLNILYAFIKIFPVSNKVTLISRQQNTPSQDFQLLKEAFNKKYPYYEVIILTKKLEAGFKQKLEYLFHLFVQMYHIATSKAVILDSYCIPISILKQREELIVVQMWHAMGALKKFGYSVAGKEEGSDPKIIELMNMHKNYTYALTSSVNTIKYFAEAFNVKEEIVKPIPLPRTDVLLDKKYIEETKKELIQKYPELKERKTILYVPTFRKDGRSYARELVEAVDTNKYNLIIKEHPLVETTYDSSVVIDFKENSQKALIIADYIITDYSAIMFEAVLLNKPIFLYTPDIEDYDLKRGFYIDFKKEIPFYMSTDINKVIGMISQGKFSEKESLAFKKKYINIGQKSSVDQIIELLEL